MSLIEKHNLIDYPPFLTGLLLKIRESELLENEVNVSRLQFEAFEVLLRYLVVLKVAVLTRLGSRGKTSIKKQLSNFRNPTSSQWFNLLAQDDNLLKRLPSGISSGSGRLGVILSEFISGGLSHETELVNSVLGFTRDIGAEDINCASNSDLIKILDLCRIDRDAKDQVQDLDHLRRSNKLMSKCLGHLLKSLNAVFEYRVATLESYVIQGTSIDNYFRMYYGLVYLPFSLRMDERLRIGSVHLVQELENGDYERVVELSPFLNNLECREEDCGLTSLFFFKSYQQGHCKMTSFHCGHEVGGDFCSEVFDYYWPSTHGFSFSSPEEEIYYRKLLAYWESGDLEDQDETTLQTMRKVFNIPVERLRLIELRIKSELGIVEDQERQEKKSSYRKLFEKFFTHGSIQDMERLTLYEHARDLGLRKTEIWDIELECLVKGAQGMMEGGASDDLQDLLVQISLLDLNNPILDECKRRTGVDVSDHELVHERKKSLSEYLGYLHVVYADKVVTPEERRFLQIQRTRLCLSEREAFELEILQEELVDVLEYEQDDHYLMQTENFSVGGILLAKGVITEEQLNHALEVQSRDPATKLGAVIYSLGYISHWDLNQVLNLQEHLYFKKESHFLGRIALKFAFIDQRQLKDALRYQEQLFQEKGLHRQLGEILLDRGWISRQTLDFMLSIQSISA
jgi:hypothetical protein